MLMAKKAKDLVTKGMTLAEVVSKYPKTIPVMLKYGLHCIGCHVAAWETVEQGAAAHGLSKEKAKALLRDLNNAAKK